MLMYSIPMCHYLTTDKEQCGQHGHIPAIGSKTKCGWLATQMLGMQIKPYTPDFTRAFDHFCIHPGGKAVIAEVRRPPALLQCLLYAVLCYSRGCSPWDHRQIAKSWAMLGCSLVASLQA